MKWKNEIIKDVTEFFGLIRKLSNHGYSQNIIETMVANAFWYDRVKNNLSNEINIWSKSRIDSIMRLNPEN